MIEMQKLVQEYGSFLIAILAATVFILLFTYLYKGYKANSSSFISYITCSDDTDYVKAEADE